MSSLDRFFSKATLLCFLGMLACAYYEHVEEREEVQIERLQTAVLPGPDVDLFKANIRSTDYLVEIEPLALQAVKLHRKRG